MAEVSSYNGSASEAEESVGHIRTPRSDGSRSGGEAPQAEPKRVTVPRRPKLDADRVLDNRNGVNRLVEEMRKLKLRGKGHEVADLDTFIRGFEDWARILYPYGQNILDFARTVETELGPQRVRSRLLDYRQDYVKELSKRPTQQEAEHSAARSENITQEELMRKKEENRRKAMEKLKQKELEKQNISESPLQHPASGVDAQSAQAEEEIAMDTENRTESDNLIEI